MKIWALIQDIEHSTNNNPEKENRENNKSKLPRKEFKKSGKLGERYARIIGTIFAIFIILKLFQSKKFI